MMGIILPDVRVVASGLFVQVFFFRWIFVPWEGIVEVKSGFRKSILRKEGTVILVRKLTPFHWLSGVLLIGRLKPGFRIDSSISGYDELVSVIQEKAVDL